MTCEFEESGNSAKTNCLPLPGKTELTGEHLGIVRHGNVHRSGSLPVLSVGPGNTGTCQPEVGLTGLRAPSGHLTSSHGVDDAVLVDPVGVHPCQSGLEIARIGDETTTENG